MVVFPFGIRVPTPCTNRPRLFVSAVSQTFFAGVRRRCLYSCATPVLSFMTALYCCSPSKNYEWREQGIQWNRLSLQHSLRYSADAIPGANGANAEDIGVCGCLCPRSCNWVRLDWAQRALHGCPFASDREMDRMYARWWKRLALPCFLLRWIVVGDDRRTNISRRPWCVRACLRGCMVHGALGPAPSEM